MRFACALALCALVWPARARADRAVRFDPASARPYFSRGPAAAAARQLRLEDYAAAAKGFSLYVRHHRHAHDVRQARFLLAYAELKVGQFNRASADFDALGRSYPLLADYAHAWSARAHLAAGRAKDALARAKLIPSESALDGDARLLRADALAALERWDEAAVEYRGYLAAYPASWRAAEARFHLGVALASGGHAADAIAQFREVYLKAPEQPWGKQAADRLTDDAARRFDAADLATRAGALFDAMRNGASELEWGRVLTAPQLTDELACSARYHLAQSVFKERDRPRAAPLFEAAAAACEKAHDEDLTVKSLYQAGRSFGVKGEKDPTATLHAASLFEEVWQKHPQHSYADDARLREAELYDELKNEARSTELYAGIPTAFPHGDMCGEALWRLAFRAWRKGDLAGARQSLDRELALLPREDGWWEAGRTLYWLARVAERMGASATAVEDYERAVHQYPLSYYALLALTRLRADHPNDARKLLAELRADPGDHAGWRWQPRALFGEAAFRRGVELARLGLGPEAKRELTLAGLAVPTQRNAVVTDPDQKELLWLAAVLYDRAGEVATSHFIPRYLLTDYAREWPVGPARKKWLLSYPRGYADLIEKNTRIDGQPAALELAIVREESAFDPLMESFANAVGLTQLTPAPAARFARGLPHDRIALHDPAINVAIGARELGELWHRYRGRAALAIAGYNAGAGAVHRWLADPDHAGMQLDEFVESIPYDETRGYTKRVMGSYFAYLWLNRQQVPAVSFKLPPH